MTPDQWDSIRGSLNSIRILLFSLAKTHPMPAELQSAFQAEKELLETFSLNIRLSERALAAQRAKISDVEKAIWG